jgi:hypothetical protein
MDDAMAEIVQSLVLSAGGPKEVLQDFFAEGRRDAPRDERIGAYLSLLSPALSDLRISANGGDTRAARTLGDVHATLEVEIEKGGFEPGILLLIAGTFAHAGVDPGPTLQNAMMSAMQAMHPQQLPGDAESNSFLEELAAETNNDPFLIHAQLEEMAAAFPPDHRAPIVVGLAGSANIALREAAVGFAMSPERVTYEHALQLLVAKAAEQPPSAVTVARLVRMRPWFSAERRQKIDEAVRALRSKALPPVADDRADTLTMLGSAGDGAGASGLYAIAKQNRRFVLCSILLKDRLGVADAFAHANLSRHEVDRLMSRLAGESGAAPISRALFERRLRDALAVNVASDTPPPFGLVQVAEVLALAPLHPEAIDAATLVESLLSDVPEAQKNERAVRAAHKGAANWHGQVEHVQSWFEAGEDVERLLSPLKTRKERVAAVLRELLPARRAFWASSCAWTAAFVKDSDAETDMLGSLWLDIALVARDLVGTTPLDAIPLMKTIAAASVEAFEGRG